MKKPLNILLLVSFLITIIVPVTGIHIHKLASALFLLLTIIHTALYRKGIGAKRFLLLGLVVLSFASGLFGMIFDRYPWVLTAHKVISIAVVFFAAIHIFVFRNRLRRHRC